MDARRGLSCIRATSLPHNGLPQDVSHIQQTPPAVGSRDHAGENLSGRGQLLQAVRLDRAFLPSMLRQGAGVIVHISSIQRRLPLHDATLAYVGHADSEDP